MIQESYKLVMDDEHNAFSNLPKTTRFQMMTVLAFIWSVAFSFAIGSYMLFGPTLIAHLAVLIALFFTADVFRKARTGRIHHRDVMRNPRDGTALHDDLWGG